MNTSIPHVFDRGTLHGTEWAVLSGGAHGLCGYALLPSDHPAAEVDQLPDTYRERLTVEPAAVAGGFVTLRLTPRDGDSGKDVRNDIVALVKQAHSLLTEAVIPG